MAMQLPIQVTFKDLPHSMAIERNLREKANKLNLFFHKIISCRIVVESPQKNQHSGKLYKIRIALGVPGEELVVNRCIDEDIYIASRDAFNAARRRLQDYARKLRGDVKIHETILHGQVARIYAAPGYGFITTPDGEEYYFSSANVVYPSFEQLAIGEPVQFLSFSGTEGPSAHRVTSGKHVSAPQFEE